MTPKRHSENNWPLEKVLICGISSTTVTTESFLVIQSLSKVWSPLENIWVSQGFLWKIHIKRSVLAFQLSEQVVLYLCTCLNKLNSMKYVLDFYSFCMQMAIRFNTRCGRFLCIFSIVFNCCWIKVFSSNVHLFWEGNKILWNLHVTFDLLPVKIKVEISQNFVAFSEYTNFSRFNRI